MYFVYKYVKVPRNNNRKYLSEAVVLQFCSLVDYVEPFLGGIPFTIFTTVSYSEWIVGTDYFICKQFPLVTDNCLGKILDLTVMDIGKIRNIVD